MKKQSQSQIDNHKYLHTLAKEDASDSQSSENFSSLSDERKQELKEIAFAVLSDQKTGKSDSIKTLERSRLGKRQVKF